MEIPVASVATLCPTFVICFAPVGVPKHAGHHLYADRSDGFNEEVDAACRRADKMRLKSSETKE